MGVDLERLALHFKGEMNEPHVLNSHQQRSWTLQRKQRMVALTSCMLMLVARMNMCGAVLAMGLALEEGGALSVDAGVAVAVEREGPGGVGFCR